ncbi:MAG: bifunctional transaldolase/phosoglucose isomerase [Nitrospirae bacterium]|nr:MAG: bifunctional transaldolase/phosoglucose isomerase [Nitrospirota bacterium]
MNPLIQLREAGQSPWYDYIRRGLITSGDLQLMIEQDGLMGITSNPSIFEKAIAGSTDYDQAFEALASSVIGVKELYESLAIEDIRMAADLLRPVYERTQGKDGYVSLEVSPELAYDTKGTIEEATRLFQAADRPNVMIKVPGTSEGLPAIEQLLSQGININVTLLFSVEVYERVAHAYIRALEALAARGEAVDRVASVASFFVSRIDTLVDQMLERQLKDCSDPGKRETLQRLLGKAAIANAKMAYQAFQRIFGGQAFAALRAKGARVQRLLWASTGTKNPRYPDTYYVDNLIGPDTVNTMPAATFTAFRDHGVVRPTLTEGIEEAKAVLARLAECGVNLSEVTERLLHEGTRLFRDAFDQLMGAIQRKREHHLGPKLNQQRYAVGEMATSIQTTLQTLQEQRFVRRLWAKDPTLWHRDPKHQQIIRHALGWLTIIEQQIHHVSRLKSFADEVRAAGFCHVLLLGMGGSSLCPEVFRMTFGVIPGYPELHVLDSTVPAQIVSLERRMDLSRTLCVVASKSGSTIEPLMFHKYFFERLRAIHGDNTGDAFVAITDPGSLLESLAQKAGFRAIFPGVPDIGGRYSALSNFGMVPAALMGINIEHLLYRAERMRHSCDACVPAPENPGVVLGVTLAQLAQAGHDKVTFVASPTIWDLGAWLEQLLAESTGKEGKGLIPVDDEPLGTPEVYGPDRVFVYLRDSQNFDPEQEAKIAALEQAGYPVIYRDITDLINLGEEFFLWEMATAVAGSLMGINAFDQPNVQESKDYTKALLTRVQESGRLPEESPICTEGTLRVYADPFNRDTLGTAKTLDDLIKAHLARVQPHDYVALNVFLEHTPAVHRLCQRIRLLVRDAKHVATTLGYGPRYLHSTGQLHKGGPNTGVFLQITGDDTEDLPIPEEPYTFGILKTAQALGDLESLSRRQRRVLRIHLGTDIEKGLSRLQQAVEKACAAQAS